MRVKRWLSSVGFLLAVALGMASGVSLALLSARPALAGGLEIDRVSVVSYRGGGDNVPPTAYLTGWEAPMFYTTPAEGAYPDGPEGRYPTGPWAPGDRRERTLVVRNTDPDFAVHLEGLVIRLSGELELADWYHVVVRTGMGQHLFSGSLKQLAATGLVISDDLIMTPGQEQVLLFTVAFDRNTDQRLQGRTVRAEIIIRSSFHGSTTGKVTEGMLDASATGSRKTGGFIVQYKRGDTVPTGQLEFQDHGLGLNFHAGVFDQLLVSLDRTRSWFSGFGSMNGHQGYTFRARAYDFGEPGRTDEFAITIYGPDGLQVYSSGNLLAGGNIQIHK